MLEKLRIDCEKSQETNATNEDVKVFTKRKRRFHELEIEKRDVEKEVSEIQMLLEIDEDEDSKSFFHPPIESPKDFEVLCGNINFV